MDWYFPVHSVVTTLTSAFVAIILISQYETPMEKVVDLISNGNTKDARLLWESLISENKGINQTELLEKMITKSFELESSSGVSVKLSKFISSSVTKSEKPWAYYQIYQLMDSKHRIFNCSEVFAFAKYILDDNVQTMKLPGVVTDKGKNLNMLQVIPKPVWSSLQQKAVMLLNRKYSSYLYIDTSGQMQGWNNRLTNERQAIFNFRPKDANPGDEDGLHFEWNYGNVKLGVQNNMSSSFGNVYKNSNMLDLWTIWTLELVSHTSVRIRVITESSQGVLSLQNPQMHNISRSQVYVQFGSISPSSESLWEIIN